MTRRRGFARGIVLVLCLCAPASAQASLTWSRAITIDHDGAQALTAVTCPSSSRCVAVDRNGQEVAYDPASPTGAQAQPVEPGAGLTSVSCPSPTQCTAMDENGRALTFEPDAPGRPPPFPLLTPLLKPSISCPSPHECAAVDYSGSEVTFDPASPTGATPTTIGSDMAAIACPSASECVAVGNEEVTFDPASPGTAVQAGIDPQNLLTSVSCPTVSSCAAVDARGNEVTFNPASARDSAPTSIDGTALNSVACSSSSQCTALDSTGHAVTFNPAAAGHPAAYAVDPMGGPAALACLSASHCTAVDDRGRAVSIDPGTHSAASPSAIDAGGNLVAVSCPTASQCTAVDQSGAELTFNPTAPSSATTATIDPGGGLISVACPSARECVAVDGVHEVTFDPTAPGRVQPISIDQLGLSTLACAGVTQCTAIDYWNRALTFNPRAPSAQTFAAIGPGADHHSWDLACASIRQCTAVRPDGGIEVTFDPTGEAPSSGEHQIDDYRFVLIAVSCPTISQCTAVDTAGKQVTFDPQAPGSPTPMSIDPNGGGLVAVSCPSAVYCVAGDMAGNAVEGNPQAGSWSVDPLEGSNSVQSVSCSSPSRCVAVDNGGRVTVGQAGRPLPVSDARPAISGVAHPGQTLSGHGGHWEFEPSTLTRQWQRCDRAGSSCTAIRGATGSIYRVTSADLGHTIRIEEWARNSAGTGGPAVSAPTQTVYLAAGALRAALKKILVPHGRAARIGSLLSHRGYTLSFAAPSAGRLAVAWYRATGVKGRGRRMLFASRTFVIHRARHANLKLPLTRRGRRQLSGARAERLTATATFTPIAGPSISATRTFVLVR